MKTYKPDKRMRMSLKPEYYFQKVERLKREGKLPGKQIIYTPLEMQVAFKKSEPQNNQNVVKMYDISTEPKTITFY